MFVSVRKGPGQTSIVNVGPNHTRSFGRHTPRIGTCAVESHPSPNISNEKPTTHHSPLTIPIPSRSIDQDQKNQSMQMRTSTPRRASMIPPPAGNALRKLTTTTAPSAPPTAVHPENPPQIECPRIHAVNTLPEPLTDKQTRWVFAYLNRRCSVDVYVEYGRVWLIADDMPCLHETVATEFFQTNVRIRGVDSPSDNNRGKLGKRLLEQLQPRKAEKTTSTPTVSASRRAWC